MGIAQTIGLGLGELAARHDVQVHSFVSQRLSQYAHARCDLLDADVVIVSDMRRCAHHRDAVLLGLTRHRHAVVEAERSIVEPRQDVTVEIDHGLSSVMSPAFAAGAGLSTPSDLLTSGRAGGG